MENEIIRCTNCGWLGYEDELMTQPETNNIGKEEDDLSFVKVCPNCSKEEGIQTI